MPLLNDYGPNELDDARMATQSETQIVDKAVQGCASLFALKDRQINKELHVNGVPPHAFDNPFRHVSDGCMIPRDSNKSIPHCQYVDSIFTRQD
jgi:hypothetical protein